MIDAMRLALMVLILLSCESKDDFPPAPSPYAAHDLPLVMHEGTLDGTGYKIEVPQGTGARGIGPTEVVIEAGELKITVRLGLESTLMVLAIQAANLDATNKEERPDGWLFTYQGGGAAYGHTYVDDGALTCFAQTPNDGQAVPAERTQKLIRICRSLQATTPIAHPKKFPPLQSPRELRAAACDFAIAHVQRAELNALDAARRKARNRPTKLQLTEQRAAEEARDLVYTNRRRTCERSRWSDDALRCLEGAANPAEAALCTPGW